MIFCILSGLLTGLLFIINDFSFLSFFTIIPFIAALEKTKNGYKCGFLFGISLNLVAASFVLSMHPLDFIGLDGFKSFSIVLLAYLGICLLEGILSGIFWGLYKKIIKSLWFLPVFYVLFEVLTSTGPYGFTFSHLCSDT